ncbi:MAG: malic enzyme-like NAD(P)-binding protein [Methylophilaceae bacterium]
MAQFKKKALLYHSDPKPGKLSVIPSKPCETFEELSLAYTPGVAEPVREISENPELAYKYTNKGNLVAVITNGTAVLGLGDVGALASKPVMEGKGVLFKKFADIDVYDIEINTSDPDEFIQTVINISPTFGGINLEDIKAPECFYIENELKRKLDIPVFHDDQHGTSVIVLAGLMNALEIQEKNIEEVKIVFLGAGAAGCSCARLLKTRGAKNIIMVDKGGVLYKGRKDLNEYNSDLAFDTHYRELSQVIEGADVFIGVSGANLLNPMLLNKMSVRPVIFALANPDPEILPSEAFKVRNDILMATGRSDFPNQVNNVLGFPFLFRGALDAKASKITTKMLLAAADALAGLAKEPVPASVLKIYNLPQLIFGKDYFIPKPFDPRLLEWVAKAVERAAIE